ncbi:putative 2-dehydropantoate [Cyphellophora attinorum]|uniref:2-dehydropantoate 2-reductase n=1 Tax=Cyphellophora attinorum TaxID=1664694 RepID=A0A0N0NHR3_9EURO|nr:putative 2-dehydropantoate [Phialophora attinorum]KPI34569.1 putative 2-dehydropantoate [Phialophora attinorum]
MASGRPPPNVLLFGTGSVGAVYLYELLAAGCKVTAVCRSNYGQVAEHGFRLTSVRHGNQQYRPTQVVQTIYECQDEVFDYILICSKAFPGSVPSLAELLQPALQNRPDTVIVMAQNGIMLEDELAQAYPDNVLLSGVVYLPATQTAPGVIEYPEMLNLLELGTYPADATAPAQAKAHDFAELIRRGGGASEVHDNIQTARWTKLVMNATWNPICALSLCTDGEFLLSSELAFDLVWKNALEVISLAKALGVPGVTEDAARSKLKIAIDRSKNGTGRANSMLQDVRQNRPFEVEAILGNMVRLAKLHGVDVPRLETLYALLKGRLAAQMIAAAGKTP